MGWLGMVAERVLGGAGGEGEDASKGSCERGGGARPQLFLPKRKFHVIRISYIIQ